MIWTALDARFEADMLGYIPGFLSEDDPRPAREQIDANYKHGGGVRPMDGWKVLAMKDWQDPEKHRAPLIQYDGDPVLHPLCMTTLRDETILFYPHAFIMICQLDGSFIVFRCD